MTAEDYLNKYVDIQYRIQKKGPYVITLVDPLDAINVFHTYFNKTLDGIYFVQLEGNSYDGSITNVRGLLYEMPKCREINEIARWVDTNLFRFMLKNAEFPQSKTELVRLRIAVNKIYNLNINKDVKTMWADWIKELYWNRKTVLNKWYIDEILPF